MKERGPPSLVTALVVEAILFDGFASSGNEFGVF